VAGAELGDLVAVARDLGLTLLDDEQVVGVVALVDEVLARRDGHLAHPDGHLAPRLVGQRREERDLLKGIGIHVSPRSMCLTGGSYGSRGGAVDPAVPPGGILAKRC